MPFDFPALADIAYRLRRLRRLIALGTCLPFFTFALMGLLGLNWLAGSTLGLAFIGVILIAVIAGHAVVFPNVTEETLAISFVLTGFALIMSLFNGSFLGWVLFIVLAIWSMMWGQGKINAWQTDSKPQPSKLVARVKVKAETEAARNWFPLRPDSERGQYRCGSLDKNGVFPVWFDMNTIDLFAGLELSDVPDCDTDEEVDVAFDLDENDPDYVIKKALHDEAMVVDTVDGEEGAPSFWASIETDEPLFQKTRVLSRVSGDAFEMDTVVEHEFKPVRNGCVVTETETPTSFPRGMSFMMWLNDFQSDGLNHFRELLEQTPVMSIKAAHRWSLLTLIGRWFMARQINKANAAEG